MTTPQNAAKPHSQPASSVLILRCRPVDKARWLRAAARRNLSLSAWVVALLNRGPGH